MIKYLSQSKNKSWRQETVLVRADFNVENFSQSPVPVVNLGGALVSSFFGCR